MNSIPPTSATPIPQRLDVTQSPTAVGGGHTVRHRVTEWMESKLGKAALPVAALAGAAVGGGAGMLTFGPIGAAVGGAAGALLGAVLFMAG